MDTSERECDCSPNSGLSATCIIATMASSALSIGGEIYKASGEPQKQLKGYFLLDLAKVADNIATLVC